MTHEAGAAEPDALAGNIVKLLRGRHFNQQAGGSRHWEFLVSASS